MGHLKADCDERVKSNISRMIGSSQRGKEETRRVYHRRQESQESDAVNGGGGGQTSLSTTRRDLKIQRFRSEKGGGETLHLPGS